MEIVVGAYRISTLDITEITDEHPTCYFVIENCLNSVLQALEASTTAIVSESESKKERDMLTFLYLLIIATVSLSISLIFITPVIKKVQQNN